MGARILPLLVVALASLAPVVSAQGVEEPAPLVVMNLAAHPDDEDGLTMAYYRYARNAVVHSVIFNRGEGGQNEIGPELYARLGAIRTAETEAAARHLGTQVRFLNFDDFGYSKTAAETFNRWGGEDEVTGRLVYVIRKLKPDVLFTNHDTLTVGPRTQHGHHQAVGISAYRAMALAADPAYRPEQLLDEGVDLWQPKRLFLRLWRGGQDTADVRVPVGDVVPALGRSPMEVAVEAVAEHRSQGFDLIADRFRRDANHFALLWQSPDAPALPVGSDDLAADLPPNPFARATDVSYLIDSRRVRGFPDASLSISDATAVPGARVTVSWTAPPEQRLVLSGAIDTTLVRSPASIEIPTSAAPTLPRETAQYDRFVSTPPIQATLEDADGRLIYAAHLPLQIAPPLVLDVESAVAMPRAYERRLLLRPGANELVLSGEVFSDDIDEIEIGAVVADAESDRVVARQTVTAAVKDARLEARLPFDLPTGLAPGAYRVIMTGRTHDGHEETAAFEGRVLPPVELSDGLRVGFVRSYDATTEAALREIGADVIPLDSLALAAGDLADLHTIVVDIRAYLERHDLRAHNDRLLDWVRDGGHLIVTYHKTFEWNEDHPDPFLADTTNPAGFAPFPLRLGRARVTQADSPVELLRPDHTLFQRPNPISAADWDGWIQERGLYFPAEYDDAYIELIAMEDPGEEPLHSSTLLAHYGEGTYLYTALGWYRQLGAFVPGAYRVVANLVSLPLVDGRGDS